MTARNLEISRPFPSRALLNIALLLAWLGFHGLQSTWIRRAKKVKRRNAKCWVMRSWIECFISCSSWSWLHWLSQSGVLFYLLPSRVCPLGLEKRTLRLACSWLQVNFLETCCWPSQDPACESAAGNCDYTVITWWRPRPFTEKSGLSWHGCLREQLWIKQPDVCY